MRKLALAGWWVAALLAMQVASSAPPPGGLGDLQAWALQDLAYMGCPLKSGSAGDSPGDFLCSGAGPLVLSPDALGASFVQSWILDVAGPVALPGAPGLWPAGVRIDDAPAPVVGASSPHVWLAAGRHRISGRWDWASPPALLPAPPQSPWRMVAPEDSAWKVAPGGWTGPGAPVRGAAGASPSSLQVSVSRLLEDAAPPRLVTRVRLAVAGPPRTVDVGPVLPAGFSWSGFDGDVPARWSSAGNLLLDVSPGVHELTLHAHGTDLLADVVLPPATAPWPDSEVWAYRPDDSWRATRATGGAGIEPERAATPQEWHSLATFVLGQGQALHVRELPSQASRDARLSLHRTAWLAFDGSSWSFRDQLSGAIQDGWRLEVSPPLRMTHAEGESGRPLLITRLADSAADGVEWRSPVVGLQASLETPRAATLPASGWLPGVDRVDWNVNLPYGHVALAAWGPQEQEGTWWSSWTIWDAFIAALVGVLALRGWGARGLLVSIAYVLLSHAEPGAPFLSVLVVLVIMAFRARAPEGALARGAFVLAAASLVFLVFQAVPFAAGTLRAALHPQLGTGFTLPGPAVEFESSLRQQAMEGAAPARKFSMRAQADVAPAPPSPPAGAIAPVYREPFPSLPPDRVAQAGVGDPSWSGAAPISLSWARPVAATEPVRLWLLPPSVVRPLRIVLAVLVLLGLWSLARRAFRPAGAPHWTGFPRRPLAGALLAILFLPPGIARAAELPDPGWLPILRSQAKPPACAPACAAIESLEISGAPSAPRWTLVVHAASPSAVPLPVSLPGWPGLMLDGVPFQDVVGDGDMAYARLPAGVHRLSWSVDLPSTGIQASFPVAPHRVHVDAGILVLGLSAEGVLLGDSVMVLPPSPVLPSAGGDAPAAAERPGPYVEVVRTLVLGREWSVHTDVHRLSPRSGSFEVRIPPLPGEAILDGSSLDEGKHVASFAAEVPIVSWDGRLSRASHLSWAMPSWSGHSEEWRIVADDGTRLAFRGVPELQQDSSVVATDSPPGLPPRRAWVFRPRPGQQLDIAVSQPPAVPGPRIALDAVQVSSTPGPTSASSEVRLSARASRDGVVGLTLPPLARVLSVGRSRSPDETSSGELLPLPVAPEGGRLSLPVQPGRQDLVVVFQTPPTPGWKTRTPGLSLDVKAVNIGLSLKVPADRWLLAGFGPSAGPAILWWSELLVALGLAVFLGRRRVGGLGVGSAILLVLGFSTFSWIALCFFVSWLVLVDWRQRYRPSDHARWRFHFLQVGMALASLVAAAVVFNAVSSGLMASPSMAVAGMGSNAGQLNWLADASSGALPVAGYLSAPMWLYRLLMFAWAVWLATAVSGWFRHAFEAWMAGGYWRPARAPVPPADLDIPPAAAAPPP